MNTLKNAWKHTKKGLNVFWNWFSTLFGLKKNSNYVRLYLDEANMRSGIYMAFVIFSIEIWMIIRQSIERVRPQLDKTGGADFFKIFYGETSNFWLMLLMGVSMLAYCIYFLSQKKTLKKAITVTILAGLGLLLFAFIDYPSVLGSILVPNPATNLKGMVVASLLLTFFLSLFLFQVSVIVSTWYQYKGGKSDIIKSALVITLFALVCLSFGMMVGYSDYFGYAKDALTGKTLIDENGNKVIAYKQIICFLMMTMYVGCLLIWKPYISVGMLGAIFLGFHLILTHLPGLDRSVQDGDTVNYITFFISLAMVCISIYSQRIKEAQKDEELELLATRDTLTGLWAFEYFLTLASRRAKEEQNKEFIYLFLDITSFKIFNDQRGFNEGNKFLKNVGDLLTNSFPDGLVSRQGDDHYVVFTENKNIEPELDIIEKEVEKLDLDIRPGIKVGGYILKNINEDPHRSVEKARYACAELKQHGMAEYLEYDQNMHDSYHLIQYIVRHIDEAIENGHIKVYYQPVVWSKNNELCGAEALARWDDPRYGFMNPGKFVNALENAQLIYKLDIAMLRIVCSDLRHNMDKGYPVIPVSINFSRLDFMIMDLASEIEKIVNEYNIPKHLIHVEVTESALLEQGDTLKKAMKSLKEKGFAIWLDDFGSGYSSFNALKDYDFDVLKLDMEFLKSFDKNTAKSKAIIQSVITMAEQVGMMTLSEGVETKEQAEFLKSISCGRLQGYLFGKPIPYDELKKKIETGELKISKEIK